MEKVKVKINTEFIKLNQFLKWAGIVESGGEANHLILSGSIKVNDQPEKRKGRKLYAGDIIEVDNNQSFQVID